MKYAPRRYQGRAEDHGLANDVVAKFIDMGLGKTVIVLTEIAYRLHHCWSKGALIIGPIKVIEDTWPKEIEKWDHTRHLRTSIIRGSEKQREAALKPGADVYLINYEQLIWLADWLHDNDKLPFDTLIFDESSKMKSPDTRRFKLFKGHLGRFSYRQILSGTPAPNSYQDLWSQLYLLDQGQRLGKYFTHFRDRHFAQADYMGYKWELRPGHDKIIQGLIADIALTLRSEDYITMPPMVETTHKVELSARLMVAYDALEKDMFAQLDAIEIETFSAAGVTGKCRQFVAGALYKAQDINEDGKPIGPRYWDEIHGAKLDRLHDIVDEAQGSPIMILYHFKHSIARLQREFPKAATLGARGSSELITQWNAGKLPIMLAHPATASHGLNLQFGGHIQVWYDLTYSLEAYQQGYKRLYRPGQKLPVVVHRLACPGTVDDAMLAALSEKGAGQDAFLNALKNYRKSKQNRRA